MVAVAAQIGSAVVGTQGTLATVVEIGGDEEREGSYLSCFGQEMEVTPWDALQWAFARRGATSRGLQQSASSQEVVDEFPMALVFVAALDGGKRRGMARGKQLIERGAGRGGSGRGVQVGP